MKLNPFWNRNKKGQIYIYDVFAALILSAVLFYVSLSHFMVSEQNSELVTFDEANDLLGFLTSTKVSDLAQLDTTLNETLGLSIKQHIIFPDTTLAETILTLYYVNLTRLDETLNALDPYILDNHGRFNYRLSLSNETDKFFYNHSNVAFDIDKIQNSAEYSSASILVTYGNLTEVYGPAIMTITVWKD
ncbi:MAG: hypothetical protein PWP03_471 [Candidatus Woesearchaeota archaeon]|nr:hypothetical protein [Candidatus Woesearchaeota archaeon]MDN5327833.1 hypothetical protein [Candidatus Woesearchaeota archaeon]